MEILNSLDIRVFTASKDPSSKFVGLNANKSRKQNINWLVNDLMEHVPICHDILVDTVAAL